ncbi:hypothetical protein SDC9_211573 [bioreactor metagenome]|uniref:Uncharacterized protein n=1 Tax=bioreactor metagenome TaxID=1076179 RepID=A0A645JKC0_9ZZZZ
MQFVLGAFDLHQGALLHRSLLWSGEEFKLIGFGLSCRIGKQDPQLLAAAVLQGKAVTASAFHQRNPVFPT